MHTAKGGIYMDRFKDFVFDFETLAYETETEVSTLLAVQDKLTTNMAADEEAILNGICRRLYELERRINALKEQGFNEIQCI